MGKYICLLGCVLLTTATLGFSQIHPGMQQPGMGPGGMGQPGTQRPGLGQPGMGDEQDQMPQLPQRPKVDDATLQRQLQEQLSQHPDFANVKAAVNDGWVRLVGSVPSKEDRKEARTLARSVQGVQGVKEKLTVAPNSATNP